MHRPFQIRIYLLLFVQLFLYSNANGQTNDLIRKNDVAIEMNDGVCLFVDIFLPKTDKSLPVIFYRTPYGKQQLAGFAEYWAKNGYVVVAQDTRGKWSSEGVFSPFINELNDGLATLDWISSQEWCNGKVGMWGPSYMAYNAFILAAARHPALKTIFAQSGWLKGEKIMAPGGAFHLQLGLPWMLHEATKTKRSLVNFDLEELFEYAPLSRLFDSLDLYTESNDEQAGGYVDFIDTLNPVDIEIPVFHVMGWYDFVTDASLEIYDASKSKIDSNKLLIGPWFHSQELSGFSEVGDVDFGKESVLGIDSLKSLTLQWFDFTLKGKQNAINNMPEVKLFLMGENKWNGFNTYPPADITFEKWYISSSKGANSLEGDGALSKQIHDITSFDTYIFDPENPVPTFGGANFHFFLPTIGIRDQRDIEKRDDVLVYTSEVLENDLKIIGPVEAHIYVSTSGRDTDFTAKLVEVTNDGTANIINEGIVRASYRNGTKRELLEPDEIYQIHIDIGNTANTIKKGNRIRLEISSSNFPKYDRNPNTGEEPFNASVFKEVEQKVYMGNAYPSYILLPILKK